MDGGFHSEETHLRGIGHDYTYRVYPQRWRMLAIVFLLNFVIQIYFTTFMPIATPAANFYDVGLTAINWLALIWAAVFLPCTAIAGWAMFKFGLRRCMMVSSVVVLVGSVIRACTGLFGERLAIGDLPVSRNGTGAYTMLIIGSVVMALPQPTILSSTTLTAAAWFSEKQRNLANTIVRTPSHD
jgi:MFS family permease